MSEIVEKVRRNLENGRVAIIDGLEVTLRWIDGRRPNGSIERRVVDCENAQHANALAERWLSGENQFAFITMGQRA